MDLYQSYLLVWEALEKDVYYLLMIDDDKIKRCISVLSGINSFTFSGSIAMSNADDGGSNVSESLWLNSTYSANGDSGNILMRICVWSSSAGVSTMAEVDSEDNGTCGYATISAGLLLGGNGELLSLNQVHYHSAVDE